MPNEKMLEPCTLYYSVQNGGDGSAYPRFFLTNEACEYDQETEGWGETCTGSVESYVGSSTWNNARDNENEQREEREEETNG